MAQNIAALWKAAGVSAQRRGDLFDGVMSLYRFSYLGEHEHEQFVRHCLTDEETFNKMQSSMSMVVTQLDASGTVTRPSTDTILDSMVYRYPIYYGGHVSGSLSESADIKEVLGYEPVKEKMPPIEGGVRYAYGGWARVNKKGWEGKDDGIAVVHVWGVNLESKGTHDFKTYVDPHTHRLKTDTYKAVTKTTLHMACKAAVQSAARVGNTQGVVCVRLPLIGLGAFLSALPNRADVNSAYAAFFQSITELLGDTVSTGDGVSVDTDLARVRVTVCIFDQSVHKMDAYKHWVGDARTQQLIGGGRLVEERDLFDVKSPPTDSRNETICLVNAWDSRSYVGNGGACDPTIDGFIVSARGPGSRLPNSSYLHNPFYATQLLDCRRWCYL
eukprot:GDKI01017604.1.p1 GENE.GDKI01017604.1~~GDKI01017604.1.p1  ORF type:complete len:410 (-),score=96.81 GDKI01017604.1:203-1360(-)